MKIRIAILGSTGSIGTQALDVIKKHPEKFEAEVLTAQNNAVLLIEQSKAVKPNCVVIGNEKLHSFVFSALDPLNIKVYAGKKALTSVMEMDTIDVVLTAIVGYSGLMPTIRAIETGKTIALANKETLVAAGEVVTSLAREKGVNILPVDSEHSAIFQCLMGESHNPIEKIILTASGGPFRGRTREELRSVTKSRALKHPNWEMGAKITIDSATMMNKGLEIIEAKWLFGLTLDQIEVVVHPQSIIHSLVQFQDGSVKAQLGVPDMRIPLQFAMGYPDRLPADYPRFDFAAYPRLTFEQPDRDTFRSMGLAYEAAKNGGNQPCILNAANEIAVQGFLEDKIGFLKIPDVIENCLQKVKYIRAPVLEDLVASDKETRAIAIESL